ncbi:MAG: pirin [Williamsia sp.]|nr:pirin [Williamsia sp.]
MLDQSQGKMFLAAERGHTETDWFRSYNTFNFGNYRHEHKAPFGPLYVLNDDTLAGGKKMTLQVEEDAVIILLPTVGAIIFIDSQGYESIVEAGQAQVYAAQKNTSILIGNPYDDALINFLQIWVRQPVMNAFEPLVTGFDLVHNKNKLMEITGGHSLPACFIGKFEGRQEAIYPIRQGNGLFVFVLEGAFEVQYRLLETRDGLALWNTQEAELEALSNDAIILLVEVPV